MGQIENINFLLFHFSVDTMALDHVEKTAFFHGKSLEIVNSRLVRIKHVAKNISLRASRTPAGLECFLQFCFANIVFMFLLHYTCRILCSVNSRKVFKFLSKRLVLLLYGNQYRHLYCVHINNVFVVDEESRGWGILFLRARVWGIDRQVR